MLPLVRSCKVGPRSQPHHGTTLAYADGRFARFRRSPTCRVQLTLSGIKGGADMHGGPRNLAPFQRGH
jgi:hypothetical protein